MDGFPARLGRWMDTGNSTAVQQLGCYIAVGLTGHQLLSWTCICLLGLHPMWSCCWSFLLFLLVCVQNRFVHTLWVCTWNQQLLTKSLSSFFLYTYARELLCSLVLAYQRRCIYFYSSRCRRATRGHKGGVANSYHQRTPEVIISPRRLTAASRSRSHRLSLSRSRLFIQQDGLICGLNNCHKPPQGICSAE